MPTIRRLETPSATNGSAVVAFEHREGSLLAIISTSRGRAVSLGHAELLELGSAIEDARQAIAAAAPAAELDEAGA